LGLDLFKGTTQCNGATVGWDEKRCAEWLGSVAEAANLKPSRANHEPHHSAYFDMISINRPLWFVNDVLAFKLLVAVHSD
jgi:hypothetical protein